jgi:hypothetical protein
MNLWSHCLHRNREDPGGGVVYWTELSETRIMQEKASKHDKIMAVSCRLIAGGNIIR